MKDIEILEEMSIALKEHNLNPIVLNLDKYNEAISNIIKERQADKEKIKELESDKEIKDKMIKLMSEHLTTPIHSQKDVIEYFENLAKESGEIDEG